MEECIAFSALALVPGNMKQEELREGKRGAHTGGGGGGGGH